MIRLIKVGRQVLSNIEPKYVDENGNESWSVPNTPDELRQALIDTILYLQKGRIQSVLDRYGYNSLGDVKLYAEQNDTEAQALLGWYLAYDNEVWNYINNSISKMVNMENMLALDLMAKENELFQNSISTAPLP